MPVRELFGLAAAFTPFLLYKRLLDEPQLNHEKIIRLLALLYLLIRYGLSNVFKRVTVHRGMYHSIPGMLIAGLIVYLLEANPMRGLRVYLAAGVMLGFLSHLVLDELCSVDFMGVRIRLNKYAGSAFKFMSPSWTASLATYRCWACWVIWPISIGGCDFAFPSRDREGAVAETAPLPHERMKLGNFLR